ncbi:MAG: IS66 family transposase zinc-finger binding domain-containing protein [Paracoccaceae bacterium]
MPGTARTGSGHPPETAEQLQLALETSEIAAAAMTARMKLPDIEEKDKPKRRPIPDHIPRMEIELTPEADACADCGGRLRRIGEDVTEELEYVPGRFIVNRIVRPRLTCACWVNGSCKPRCPPALLNAAAPGRASWPMCWSASMPTICRFIARARSSTAKGST